MHTLALAAAEYVPVPQRLHAVAVESENEPAEHTVHCNAAEALEKDPAEHDAQNEAAIEAEKLPSGHGVHDEAAAAE